MDMESQVKTGSILSALAAVWLFISPYVVGFYAVSRVVMWTTEIAGIAVFVLSLIRFFIPHGTQPISWINALIGLGLIASPFVWSLTGMFGVMWDFIIVGIVVLILNIWAALGHMIAA